jgi:methionyl aminopeptidase
MSSVELKSPAQLAKMRQAGRLVAGALRLVADIAEPGITTAQLDEAADEYIRKHGGKSAFKGYRGFPANICTSLNEEVVHGIPGPRKLKEGDLLKVDVGVVWEAYYADAALTIAVGEVTEQARELLRVTQQALNAGIAVLRPGVRVSQVSAAIQQTAESHGFSVVTDYTGHGIGRALHEDPKVPNFVALGLMQRDVVLEKGATVAIEPMVNVGTERTEVLGNGWTVVTRDRKLSAHFEHTVAVADQGPVILTLP